MQPVACIDVYKRQHLLISKSVRDGRTYTDVAPLDEAGRVEELARIIGGDITPASQEAAREMLGRIE